MYLGIRGGTNSASEIALNAVLTLKQGNMNKKPLEGRMNEDVPPVMKGDEVEVLIANPARNKGKPFGIGPALVVAVWIGPALVVAVWIWPVLVVAVWIGPALVVAV